MLTKVVISSTYDNINAQDDAGHSKLHYAVYMRDNIGYIQQLITDGANVNLTNYTGQTALHLAALCDYHAAIPILLGNQANSDLRDNEGRTALDTAKAYERKLCIQAFITTDKDGNNDLHKALILNQSDEAIKELIKAQTSLNLKNNDGDTALHLATIHNRLEIFKELITAGADVDQTDQKGYSVLHLATINNLHEFFNELMTRRTDLNLQGYDGCTPLHLTTIHNRLEFFKKLISAGANVNQKDKKGYSVLHLATINNLHEFLKELIIVRANLSMKDNDGKTALDRAKSGEQNNLTIQMLTTAQETIQSQLEPAITSNNVQTIKSLITSGADLNRMNYLDQVTHYETALTLIKSGVDIDAKSSFSSLPLHNAADEKILLLLIAAKTIENRVWDEENIEAIANYVNTQNDQKQIALHTTIARGAYEAAKALIHLKARVNTIDSFGQIPLHIAASKDAYEVVSELIDAGAEINQQDSYGNTAVHYASIKNAITSLQRLILNEKADLTIRNHEGKTAQECSSETKTIEVFNKAEKFKLPTKPSLLEPSKDKKKEFTYSAVLAKLNAEYFSTSNLLPRYDSATGYIIFDGLVFKKEDQNKIMSGISFNEIKNEIEIEMKKTASDIKLKKISESLHTKIDEIKKDLRK